MDNNKFFKWASRINSILFLVLLIICIIFATMALVESNKWGKENSVTVADESNTESTEENMKLGSITNICGKEIKYIELISTKSGTGLASSGYESTTRNIIFFTGKEMSSHWLYETNKYLIKKTEQLKKNADDCKARETVAMYYEVIKNDTNKNGKLDENDLTTAAITTANGLNYKELETGATSIIDHSIDTETLTLTLLAQKKDRLVMENFSIADGRKISEKEITKISKKQ
jgi:hypothetical protein